MKYFNKILLASILIVSVCPTSFAMKFYDYTLVGQPDHPIKHTHPLDDLKDNLKELVVELIDATNQGNAKIVQRLVTTLECKGIPRGKPANLRVKDQENSYHGWTLLQIAAEKGHADVVHVLIVSGANINAKVNNSNSGYHGWTALHIAAWQFKKGKSQVHAQIVRTLMDAGTNIYAKIDNPSSEHHELTAFALLCPFLCP